MNELIERYMDRAESALEAADLLHKNDQVLALANRTYYAIFYCVSTLLATENMSVKKHEGARVKFHELFVKTGKFNREAGQILERNFEARQSADYDMETHISDEQALILLSGARTFYDLTVAYLGRIAS